MSVLLRNGTDQLDRDDTALNPDSVRLHGFELEQWMKFAYSFAEKVNYFSTEDDTNASGDWRRFFKDGADLTALLSRVQNDPDGNLTPHLTLFLCFLKLMELSTGRLNKITKRHLDFYYKEILQIETLPETEDRAYILFNLAKNVAEYEVLPGTGLDGGKDGIGKKQVYETTELLLASKTAVAQIKNVYNEQSELTDEDRFYIKAAPVANSLDGKGKELTEDEPTWYPFGYYTHTKQNHTDPMREELPGKPELPDARLGFAIASPVLRLSEGTRKVTLKFTFQQPVSGEIDSASLVDALDIYFTGEKKWIGPFKLWKSLDTAVAEQTYVSGNTLYLTTILDMDVLPVTDYVPAVHGEQFATTAPVMRFLAKTDTKKRYAIYNALAGSNILQSVDVQVDVSGMKQLVLESDTANLNPEKPFFPFTTNPVRGSAFSVYNEEVFAKKWSNISVDMNWKNTPLSFASLYTAYESTFTSNVSVSKYKTMFEKFDFSQADEAFRKDSQDYDTYDVNPAKRSYLPNDSKYTAIVADDNYFKVDSQVKYKEQWDQLGGLFPLFNTRIQADGSFETKFNVSGTAYEIGKAGPIRLVLQQSFLQEMYPRLYAIAISSTDPNTLIPNEPYIPLAEDVTLSYTAADAIDITNINQLTDVAHNKTAQLFHEHPFGQSEEHAYLKNLYSEAAPIQCRVFPTYCKGGEMYIGLENAKVSELVSLLIKVSEGTENPLAKTFQDGQKVHWEILCNNVWRTLDSSLMTINELDNFLRSGLIKFTIPPYATSDNTLLPAGLFWIRAKMYNKRYDAVCQLLGIHAQVVTAQFDDRGNELSHLASGLPKKTISKLIERVAQVKAVEQPYASFGGKPEESDPLYYKRVSERLRHKNRAITLWDYEHLVLQQFPQVYKAKCLNHTSGDHFITPGSVTLVVIPDTASKTVFDIYQPRVSRGLLNEINAYLSELNSMHVSLNVINPNYEEVRVELGAKFYAGLDENNSKKHLEEDIMKFLSPWAFERTREITFGVTLHRSILIHYIEQLDYVDYVEDVKIFKDEVLQPTNCTPSNPKSILVSARHHTIHLATKTCQIAPTIETEEKCQL